MEIFKNKDFGEIMVLTINNKEYFDAVECCRILGYSNQHDAINRHCNREGITFYQLGIVSGKKRNGEDIIQYVNRKFIDEANLYRLIVKSKLEGAKKFESWIFNEVLPTIRKYGAYIDNKTIDGIINNPDFFNKLIDNLMDRNNSYNKLLKGMEETKGFISIGTFAKVLSNNNIHIGRNRLYFWFRENGYFIKNGIDKNLPKQQYIDRGYFKVIEKIIQTENGEKLQATTRITGKGQSYFINKINEDYMDVLNMNFDNCN
jgi:anti-repressor protein